MTCLSLMVTVILLSQICSSRLVTTLQNGRGQYIHIFVSFIHLSLFAFPFSFCSFYFTFVCLTQVFTFFYFGSVSVDSINFLFFPSWIPLYVLCLSSQSVSAYTHIITYLLSSPLLVFLLSLFFSISSISWFFFSCHHIEANEHVYTSYIHTYTPFS